MKLFVHCCVVIWKLPTGNLFNLGAAAATTDYIKVGVHPFSATTTTVAQNIVAVSGLNL